MNSERASINGFNGQVQAIFAASQRKPINSAHKAIVAAKSVASAPRIRNDSEGSVDMHARCAASVILKPNRGGEYEPNLAALDMGAVYFSHMRMSLVAVNMAHHERKSGQSGCCTLL
ncbi:Uncharacterised protein [Pandoraea pulmonicola]|uniref:Uncharacterized protein n=1 Tax=Pandoraea pulmonicola TaxID=93221 RepID=A0AAJ5CZW7_PANPU|nr:Uncharacterised protein [Pandoraea pulmonicola]